MSKKVKTGLIIGIVALICVIAIVLVFVFFTDKDDEHKHTLTHSDAVAATCTEDGSVEYWICTECGKHFADENAAEELDSVVVPALGHDFADYEVKTAATCTHPGEEVSTCSRCGEEQSRTIEVLGHDWNDGTVTTPATCTQEGVMTYSCSRCSETKTETIETLDHDYVEHDGKAPTCTESGWEDYVTCTRCDYTTYQLVPSTGHKPEVIPAVAATCTQNGLTEGQKCSVCGEILIEQEVIQAPGHTPVTLPAVAPTCTSTGLTEGQKCAVCDEIIVAQQVIAMTAHNYSDKWSSDAEAHWHACTVCGDKDDLSAHIPDREQPGEDSPVKCTVCGYVIEPATGHIVHTAGDTWYSDGTSHWQTCTGCGIKMNEASHRGGTATCTDRAQCAVCGEVYGELAAHSPVTMPAVDPTCTQNGLTEGQKCSVCGVILVEQQIIPANGHTVVIDKAVEPTCTETGLTEGKHCSVCGEILVKQEEISANGHKYESSVTKQPTCTEKGVRTYTCSVCGDSYTEDIEANGHTIVIDEAVEPTCTETGLTEGKHCSVCDAVIVKQEVVAANGHKYESSVTKQPTCTEKGVRTYICSTCGDSYTEDIEANGHTIVIDEAVEPTCTDTGLTEGKHCSVCDEVLVEQEVVPMTEHSYTSEVTKQPTCSQTGERTYICSACGDSYTASIAALGHQYRVTSRKEATCTQAGEVVYTCTRCGDGYTVKTNASHNYVLVETVAATCTEAGYQLFRCSECEEEFKNIIPAGGGHNYVGTVTLAPTTEREGEMTYTCSVCGDSYTVPLAKLNSGSGYVLLIQDRLPWTTDNNAVILNYLTQSGQIGGWEVVTTQQAAATDLSAYGIIYIANDQTTATYNRLKQLGEELTQFVQGGGVLIYGACDHGWAAGDISYALPGGVSIQNYYSNYNYIVNSAHDIVTGVLTGGEAITDRILYSTYSSHTTFHDLPTDADIILQDAKGDPTLVEYALGNGYVIASGLTWEYTYERTFVDGTSFAKEIYDDLFVYAQTLISGCEHEYLAGETVAPTCSADGYTVYTCTVCGRTYHGDYVEALGHSYTSKVTKQPTCSQTGERTYTCSVCGDSYTESIPMTAHTEVIDEAVEPTCTATGLTEGKHCSVCGTVLVEQEVVPMTEHTYTSKVTKQPTCSQTGERTYTCSVCGDSYTESIPMTAHNYVDEVTKQPTCTEEGVRTYTCSVCGDNYTEDISANGHIVVIDEAVAPTCISTGLTEGKHCSVCGEVLIEQKTLPTIDHNYVDGVCTMCGKRDESYATNGLIFTLSDDGTYYSVTDYTGSAKDVYIPAVYKGLPVTSIGDEAFINCWNLTSITIPDSVTSIGDWAFSSCISLTSITIPDGVTSIGERAFYGCDSLTSVTIGNGVTSIGGSVFDGCSSLTSVVIGNGVTSIGDQAFYYCDSLTSITIPDSVTSIGGAAFYGCSSLTSITIPESVTSIEGAAFDSTAYYNDKSNWGNGVLYIGNHLIEAQDTLSGAYTVRNGTKTIADSAFYGCSSLTSITIPDSVTSIGGWAFYNCTSLEGVYITDMAAWYAMNFSSFYSNPLYYAGNLYLNGQLVTELVIPDSVTSVGDYAFYNCTNLTSVTISDSVTSVGDWAFAHCSSLTSITIPDSVTSVGDYAFYNCTNLTSITIGNGVTSIGESAFEGCTSLTSITIPDSVTSIGRSAFEGCHSLTSITLPDGVTSIGNGAFYNTAYYNDESNWENDVLYICTHLIKAQDTLSGAYSVKNGTKTIADYAFYNRRLTSITIPDSVTSIGELAFYYCTSLTSVVIGNGVTSIGELAFYYCTSLTSITIPDSVTSIGDRAFYGCSGLTSITVASGNPVYHSAGNCLIETGSKTMILGCKNSIIPTDGSVTNIGVNAFYGCDSLTSITIPDSVTSIGDRAFYDCSSLTSVTFEDPDGWQCSYNGKVAIISSSALSDPSTAAKYLTSTYVHYDWKNG